MHVFHFTVEVRLLYQSTSTSIIHFGNLALIKQINNYVSLDRATNILKRALLRANCKECLIAELIGHASVPYKSKIGKHLLFINANKTSSDRNEFYFSKYTVKRLVEFSFIHV